MKRIKMIIIDDVHFLIICLVFYVRERMGCQMVQKFDRSPNVLLHSARVYIVTKLDL